MKIFFDTNVLVSAFITRGLCADLFRLSLRVQSEGRIELLICEIVLNEFSRILRDKLQAAEQDISLACEALYSLSRVPRTKNPLPTGVADPDDAPIVAAALAAGVDFFVTGDSTLLALEKLGSMRIISPREYWERLQE